MGQYRPKHRTQLWRPKTGEVDCGPRTWQHAIDAARRDPGSVPGIDRLRELAGRPGAQPTNVYDAARAFDKLGVRYGRKVNAAWDVAVDALRAGKGLHVCVAYGTLTDLQYGKSGDKAFRGGHSIYVQELARSRDGRRLVRSFDSLYDGRRRSIPDGSQWLRLDTIRRACAAFAGHGDRWWGGVIPVADTGGAPEDDGDDETAVPADPEATPVEGTPLPPAFPEPNDPDSEDGDDDELETVDDEAQEAPTIGST